MKIWMKGDNGHYLNFNKVISMYAEGCIVYCTVDTNNGIQTLEFREFKNESLAKRELINLVDALDPLRLME